MENSNSIVLNGNSKEIIRETLFQETVSVSLLNGQSVLGATAKSRITAIEALDGELRVSVKTTFTVVKKDEEGSVYAEKEESETQRSIVVNGLKATSKVNVTARVTECEKTDASSSRLRATVEVSGWFIRMNEIVLADASRGDIKCKTEKIAVENILALADTTMPLTYTDEARMPIARVVDYDCQVSVDTVYPSAGTYRAEGELIVRVVAMADNGSFFTQSFSHPFSADNAEEFLNENMKLEVEGKIKSAEYTVTESDKRILVSDVTAVLVGVALEEKEGESVLDAYSLTNEIEKVEETTKINSRFCLRSVREKATATVGVEGGVSEVLCVLTPCVSVVGRMGEDGIVAEGVVGASVLYTDENGMTKSIVGEIPFMSRLGGEYPCETVFAPEVIVTALNARPRGGSEIELTAELLVTVRGAKEKEICVIADVVMGEEKDRDDVAISLYIVKKGETLWDVAKELNADEEVLAEQNADVALPLKGGEKIILYKEIKDE